MPAEISLAARPQPEMRLPLPLAQGEPPARVGLGYRRWLDGLRGIAILLVLAFHLGIVPGGFLGVDLFFVLSGFLITRLLLEEWQETGTISFRRFYLRRALRLLPALAVMILACELYTYCFRTFEEWRSLHHEALVAACYLSNWPTLHGVAMMTLGHTWSLSMEEQFYLLWPIGLWVMLRAGWDRRSIGLTVIGLIVAVMGWRSLQYAQRPATEVERVLQVLRLYMGFPTRVDTILVGCLVGLLTAGRKVPISRWGKPASMLAFPLAVVALGYMVGHSCLEHGQFYRGLFTGVAFLVGVILFRLLAGPVAIVSGILESAPLVGIGRLSYALYLFHVPILRWLPSLERRWAHAALALLLTLGCALVSYFAVEQPCLRLKDRLARRRTDAVPEKGRIPRVAA